MGEDEFPFDRPHHHMRGHWMRHMAMVPKGFLRYQILRMLNEKPMSGSEIMSEIEELTNGHWRPSPGSIYPLLSWLQDKDYVKETIVEGEGLKRYMLTASGKDFLEEHIKSREEFGKRFAHFGFGPGFIGPMIFGFHHHKAKELHRATRDLTMAVLNLYDRLRQGYSQTIVEEAKNILDEAAKKIQEIAKKPVE